MNQPSTDARVKTEEPAFPEPGDVFEERYRIDDLIGSGGFARVYRATQLDLGREVALKIMMPEEMLQENLPESSSEQGHNLAGRFMQEARVVAKLRDPHTVTMHDHGKSSGGLLYMVFEFIDGVSLSRLVKAQGAVEPWRVVKILKQTLSSLQEAHAMGLLHRDIKPGNIMVFEHVGRPDRVKVLDFGIAKVVGRQVSQDLSDDLTTNGALLGTPRYMSPEQIRSEELGPSTDIYSLGLVAYELLTGKKAIDSNSSVIIIGAQLDPRPFAVPNLPHVPPRLRQIVNRMLFKEREMRYASADAVLSDLEELELRSSGPVRLPARTQPLTDRTRSLDQDLPDISDSIEPLKVADAEEAQSSSADRRKLVVAGGLVVVLASIAGVAGAVLLDGMEGDDAAAVQPSHDEPGDDEPSDEGRNEPNDDEPPKPLAAKPPSEIVISTIPPGLNVYVNDDVAGKSPVSVKSSDLEYPVAIRAEVDGGRGSRTTVLDEAVPEVSLDLSMLAAGEEEGAPDSADAESPRPTSANDADESAKRSRRKRTKRDRTEKTNDRRVRDDSSGDSSDDSSDDGTLKLPALDY